MRLIFSVILLIALVSISCSLAQPAQSQAVITPPAETALPVVEATVTPEATMAPVVEPTATPSELVSDLMPKTGKGTAPKDANASMGPWATRLVLATSSDGQTFTHTNVSLGDQLGVPDMMVDREGHPRIYYIDYGNGNLIAVAINTGANAWIYKRVNIEGASGKPEPVDPTVVLLSDGRYRLYYMHAVSGLPSIYSAISPDGINFTLEEGIRFSAGANQPVFDPMVLQTADGWLLWTGPDGKYTATSSDGLNFTSTGEFKVDGVPFMTWSAVALPGEGYRLFGNLAGDGHEPGIRSAFSTDGKTWVLEDGKRLVDKGLDKSLGGGTLADIGVTRLADGTWWMACLVDIP